MSAALDVNVDDMMASPRVARSKGCKKQSAVPPSDGAQNGGGIRLSCWPEQTEDAAGTARGATSSGVFAV
jgi:hypothetical protein